MRRPNARSMADLITATSVAILSFSGCAIADAAPERRLESRVASRDVESERSLAGKSWELRTKLADMTGTDFWKWVDGKDGPAWQGNPLKVPRRCKTDSHPDCADTNKKTTNVIIEPVIEAKLLDLNRIPPKGVVISRLDIEEKFFGTSPTEAKYGMKNEDYHYFLVVEYDATAGRPKWSLVEVPKKGDKKHEHSVLTWGYMKDCNDKDPPPESQAGFYECGRMSHSTFYQQVTSKRTGSGRVLDLMSIPELTTTNYFDAPAWVSCIHGCCTAET